MQQNSTDRQKPDRTALYGCLGTVLAAIISGVFLLMSSGVLQMDAGIFRIGRQTTTEPTAVVQAQTAGPADTAAATQVAPPDGGTPTPGDGGEPTAVVEEPTATVPPADAQALVVGQPVEQGGVSLIVPLIEVYEEGRSNAPVRVSFRILNKTGTRLTVPVDWTKIHVEDSLGNRYVDNNSKDARSFTVEPQEAYDIDRYYTQRVGVESVVPPEAEYVDVIVESFSRVSGARWRFPINVVLAPMPTPDPATVKAEGEGFEADDLQLTVDRIEVQAEQGRSFAPIEVRFSLKNNSNRRRIVEIDTSLIYVLDSFGQRYSDYRGGEILSGGIDPGENMEFTRYFSLMKNQESLVPTSADFVLVRVDRLGPIENAAWRFDLAH
jgi:hypothetical protein